MTRARVVVTGVGLTTALGATRDESWSALLAGKCGIRPVTALDPEAFRSKVGGEAPMAAVDDLLPPRERRRWSRADRIGVAAATEAVHDAGVLDRCDARRIGIFLGAGTSDLLRTERFCQTWKTRGIEHARLTDVRSHLPNALNDIIAGRFGFEGPRRCVIAACSSSTIAIGQALDAIRTGRADAAIAGGSDALARLTFSGFNQLKLMDPAPCRPFDRSRAGMNIGEGAGMLVLENLELATRRGARIYAELAGYALGCEAYHATAPEPEGASLASIIGAALTDAELTASDVDHVNAHGTATPQNDLAEAHALRRVFGARARTVPVTSVKSMVGHCLGAAGAVEAAVLVMSIARSVVPPTIHHTETDPECGIDIVANEARDISLRCGVSTSLAFGGNDSALVVTAYDGRH